MSSPVLRLTVRGVLARKFRVLLTAFAIVLGVAFVSGAFMLTDSVKGAINGLFDELQGEVDLEVRARIAFGDEATAQRDPVPTTLVDTIAAVDGVRTVEVNILRQATIIKTNGKPLQTSGPSFGIAWYGTAGLDGRLILEGREARGPGEVAIDKKSAERAGYAIGETVPIVGPQGSGEFTRDEFRLRTSLFECSQTFRTRTRIGHAQTRTSLRKPERHRQTGFTESEYQYVFVPIVHIALSQFQGR